MNKKPKATIESPSETSSHKKEIPNVIKARNLETLYTADSNSPKVVDDLSKPNNDSATKLGPPKKGNSISKLIKAFEDKKDKNREAAASNLPDVDIKTPEPQVTKIPLTKKTSKPEREPAVVEIVNRRPSSSDSRKEEDASILEKEFQNRISKLIKKFEATPDSLVQLETETNANTLSIKSEPIKFNNDKKYPRNDADDTSDEVEISHTTYSEVLPTKPIQNSFDSKNQKTSASNEMLYEPASIGGLAVGVTRQSKKDSSSAEIRMKSAKSEPDIINEHRLSTASSNNNNKDLSTFTMVAKSRLTEKQNKHESKKSSNKPV